MINCYISLGSNLGNKLKNIEDAITIIANNTLLIKTSNFYQTSPSGFLSENRFINACIHIQTSKNPNELLTFLKNIEREAGRTQKTLNGVHTDRIIDLDIIFFGIECIETVDLTIPHPRYSTREFVLRPLLDLDKNLTDPSTKLTIAQYLNNLSNFEATLIVNNS